MSIENLYPSVKPSLDLNFAAGNFDPRITFSRASGATYYDGKTVAKAEENLLTYSQEFDNAAWTKNAVTVISNSASAPDGTSTADLVYPTTSGGSRFVNQAKLTVGVKSVISVYAKASGLSYLCLFSEVDGASGKVWFNISSGTVGTVSSGYSATIVDVGNGWYRCIATVDNPSGVAVPIGLVDSNGVTTVTASGASGAYFWGAQLEQRSQATAYTPTTSQPVTNYVPVLQTAPANVPRIDYDPLTGECKGLLVEEQRTNLLTYSEQFNHLNWLSISCGVRANSFVSPDGTISADLITGTALVTSYVTQTLGVSASTTYVASVFVKQVDSQSFQLKITNIGRSATVIYYNFSWVAGIPVESVTSACTVTPVGNGFFRVSFPFNSGSYTNIEFLLYPDSSNGPKSIVFWGAQLEAGAFPTSYIKTEASQVTRAADVASMVGANFYSWNRADEGSILAEWSHIAKNPGSSAANQYPNVLSFSDTRITSYGSSYDGVVGAAPNYFFQAGAAKKISAAYSGSSSQVVADGVLRNGFGAARILQGSQLFIGHNGGGNLINGHIKRITYYPKRLANTELQALTT